MTEQTKSASFGLAGWLWIITLGFGCWAVLFFAKIGVLVLWRLFL